MAERPYGYGFTAECKDKINEKYDSKLDEQAKRWIEDVTGEKLNGCVDECLRDGVVLCKLMNMLYPGSIRKIHFSDSSFKQMENIANFLEVCNEYGCCKEDMFQTVDLYEAQNIPQVISAIFALGRRAQINGFKGPTLGPKESVPNKKEWAEEVLRRRDCVINLQAGTNKCATQKGMPVFGLGRQIFCRELMED